jgi:hypothetical protein
MRKEQTLGKVVPLGPLPPSMRLSIMQKLSQEESEVWLEALRILVHKHGIYEEACTKFEELEKSWKGESNDVFQLK